MRRGCDLGVRCGVSAKASDMDVRVRMECTGVRAVLAMRSNEDEVESLTRSNGREQQRNGSVAQ